MTCGSSPCRCGCAQACNLLTAESVAHLFKLLSSPSFSEANQVECGHEEETKIKEQNLVGSSWIKGAEE